MSVLTTVLVGIGGFALGVVVTNLVELRKPDDTTILVTDREHLDELDRIARE
jgi:hypothetical protein